MNPGSAPSLELRGVSCARHGAALTGISLELSARSLHVLTSADATNDLLLRLLGLLEMPDTGAVLYGGRNTSALDEPARADLRTRVFGYVFAAPFLLPSFSVVENLAMPLFKLMETSPSDARTRAESMLEFVGLSGREEQRAGDLPAVQQHAAALARALITEPEVLIVEGLDRHLAGRDLKHYRSLLHMAIARMGVTVIATASSDWKAEPDEQVLEVSERSVTVAAPVVAS